MDQKFFDKMKSIHQNFVSHGIVAIDYSYLEPLIIVNQKYDAYYVRQAIKYLNEREIKILKAPKTVDDWDEVSERIIAYRGFTKEQRKEYNTYEKTKFNALLAAHKDNKKDPKTYKYVDDDFTDVDSLTLYLKDISSGNFRTEVLTRQQEVELFEKYHKGDMDARNYLLEANVRLGYRYVKQFYGQKVDKETFMDLIQEANLSLFRALEKFDVSRGLKFSTYATIWMRQAVNRANQKINKMVNIPPPQAQQASTILRVFEKLSQDFGTFPSDADIASYVNNNNLICVENKEFFTESDVAYYMNLYYIAQPKSLSTPVGEDQEDTLGDFIPDKKFNIEKELMLKDLKAILEQAMKECLTEREEKIIRWRFGMSSDEDNSLTLKEISSMLGITHERVRQIEKSARRKLHLHLSRFKDFENIGDL